MKNLLSNLNEESMAIVREIGVLAQAQGLKAYLVGGPVRDLLLKMPVKDLDIVVEGNGMDLAQRYANAHKYRLVRYPAFKTATVFLSNGSMVDFVSARKEKYPKSGVFPVVSLSHLKDDLFRRDFTINAMAISIAGKSFGELVDPYGGLKDLKAKKIRVLHELSFVDDPTRVLRAARFKARLGFTIEAGTIKILKDAIRNKAMASITKQRYLKEYNKIIKEGRSQAAIESLESWDALRESES